jgi:hypothetical protein
MLAAERESAKTAIRAFERRNVARGSQFYRLRLVFVKERRFLTLCGVSRSNKANSIAARTSCFASR